MKLGRSRPYRQAAGAMPKAASGPTKLSRERSRADETKDQDEQSREDERCHDWEIDTDISFLVFDVTGKK